MARVQREHAETQIDGGQVGELLLESVVLNHQAVLVAISMRYLMPQRCHQRFFAPQHIERQPELAHSIARARKPGRGMPSRPARPEWTGDFRWFSPSLEAYLQ